MYRAYSAHRERDRMLAGAIWLIALGSVFMVQQLSGWGWDRAWPLFVIFVGVGTAGSALLDSPRWTTGLWAVSWPLLIIAAGIVLLLSTTGQIPISLTELWTLWPVAIIALGVWFILGTFVGPRRAQAETLALPLEGATSAEVRLRFGGGELTVHPADPGMLVNGQFDGGVEVRSYRPGRVRLEPPRGAWPFWWSYPLNWNVGLTAEVPVDLRVDTGANRSQIDLTLLKIRSLELKTGASDTRVIVPSTGFTRMLAESGVASLTIEIPQGVAARIRSRVALGTTTVDERRFPRVFDGYLSPDFDAAANRVDIEIRSGVGAVRII